MHIVAMNRTRLIQLVEEKLPGALREIIQDARSTVRVVGTFGQPDLSRWFIGMIARVPRQRPLYIRIAEERLGIVRNVTVRASFKPFHWAEYMPGCYDLEETEAEKAYVRLRAWAIRRGSNGKAD